MAYLGFLIIFLFVIVLVPVLSLLVWLVSKFISIKRMITGKKDSSRYSTYSGNTYTGNTHSSNSTYTNSRTNASSTQRRKIIPDGEGEYVDFEEVK